MSPPPVLVLQMQRMGDLILSFPLLALLQKRYVGHPIWTVAEPRFFQHLYGFSPSTVFFPPDAHERLRTVSYRAIINLSHRADAAAIAGSLDTEARYGAWSTEEGQFVSGYWSLYRASLVHNNRHNIFHWGDLPLLEHSGRDPLPRFSPVEHNTFRNDSSTVGIFVGASEKEKRPSPDFFAQLAKALLRKGLRPVFLGGPEDTPLGIEAQRASGITGSNLCGQYSLSELGEVLRSLALFITPDTGPMHLAVWLGTRVLNLSLGPVNPWETGPFFPGHHVLRPHMSCAGCWQCQHSPATRTLPCHAVFQPARVALAAHTLLSHPERLASLHLPGLRLYRTARDARGLSTLLPLQDEKPTARHCLHAFWQDWFWARQHGTLPTAETAHNFSLHFPMLAQKLCQALLGLGRHVSRQRGHDASYSTSSDFWLQSPPLLRAFSGHAQLQLQNSSHSLAAHQRVLADVDALLNLLR